MHSNHIHNIAQNLLVGDPQAMGSSHKSVGDIRLSLGVRGLAASSGDQRFIFTPVSGWAG
jgi:hypothetical protein